MGNTKTYANLITEIGRYGRWAVSDSASVSYGHANSAAEAGLRRIERVAPWIWLQTTGTITVATGDYTYDVGATVFRVRKDSFRYSTGKDSYLTWVANVEAIDRDLGPGWRDSATANGSPKYITRVGNEFWLAPKPSATWVASYPTVYFYFIRHEVTTGTLYLPDTFLPCAWHAGLAEGLKQKDDKLQVYYENLFERQDKPDMLGCRLYVGGSSRLAGPELALDDDDFSYDGYV